LRYFYEPTVAVLRGLSIGYVEDPAFNAFFARMDEGLALFMRTVVEVYCDRLEVSSA
jgi:hypothetical protein